MRPVDKVLERCRDVRAETGGWRSSCPVPAHGKGRGDVDPSLGISEGDDRRALLRCRAGCSVEDVLDNLGLSKRDLFDSDNGHGGSPYPQTNGATAQRPSDKTRDEAGTAVAGAPQSRTTEQGCTLAEYAECKRLPVLFLEGIGLSEFYYQKHPAVRIPYKNPDGSEVATRFRLALEKSEEGDNRFRWKTGSKPLPYGLEDLERIREAGYVVLVEGESDRQTLLYHRIPALGIPGANNWKRRWSEYLEGVEKIYAVIEPDAAGEKFRDALVESGIGERLHLVELGEHKDASGLYLAYPEDFGDSFAVALQEATPHSRIKQAQEEAAAREAWQVCSELASEDDILQRFADELALSGVAGESRLVKLLYLAVTSRLLTKPVSVAMKGPSSGGKSYLTEQVLGFFPESAYYALTAMSERALAYSEEPLSHRFLVIYEAAGMESDLQTYLIRSLLSEGRVRYETVEKTSEGMKSRLIERPGPTGLLVTTTAVRLHPENETRLLSLTVTDTREQTRSVLMALAAEAGDHEPDRENWHTLQEWLAVQDNHVTIPYGERLAKAVPPVAVRLRRDFEAVLNLIRAHTILHQASRERDSRGRIMASLEDYEAVRGLVADLVSEGVGSTVPATVRATVQMVEDLCTKGGGGIGVQRTARKMGVDKSTASRRLKGAMERGFLENLEDRKGKQARYVTSDRLPDDVEVLPPPEALQLCTDAEEVRSPPTTGRGSLPGAEVEDGAA